MHYELLDHPERLVLDSTPGLFIGALSLVLWLGWARMSRSMAGRRPRAGDPYHFSWHRNLRVAGLEPAVAAGGAVKFFPPSPAGGGTPHWNGDAWRAWLQPGDRAMTWDGSDWS